MLIGTSVPAGLSGKSTLVSLFSQSSHSNTFFCGFGYFLHVELDKVQFKSLIWMCLSNPFPDLGVFLGE